LQHVVDKEIPQGLKKYMEVELFPHIHLKPGRGISLRTARQWLRREGFRFVEHKKALYYDGHERPDVVHYRQNVFLPAMEKYRARLVEYIPGPGEIVNEKKKPNCVETRLVVCAHDEMTSQANDGKVRSWVCQDEHALKKKGMGRGIHQSDVICSTVGWLKEASQSLEYGKNYEGYWTGELFVKQVRTALFAVYSLFQADQRLSDSSKKKSFRRLSALTAPGIKHCSWLIILKVTLLMALMRCSPLG
jgi:hypothetical protein